MIRPALQLTFGEPVVQTEPLTPVLFRVATYRDEGQLSRELVAVFPTLPATDDTMTCYAHIGQHGGCSFGWYLDTRAAKPAEYADLQRELESQPFGYRLDIRKRLTQSLRREFKANLRA